MGQAGLLVAGLALANKVSWQVATLAVVRAERRQAWDFALVDIWRVARGCAQRRGRLVSEEEVRLVHGRLDLDGRY